MYHSLGTVERSQKYWEQNFITHTLPYNMADSNSYCGHTFLITSAANCLCTSLNMICFCTSRLFDNMTSTKAKCSVSVLSWDTQSFRWDGITSQVASFAQLCNEYGSIGNCESSHVDEPRWWRRWCKWSSRLCWNIMKPFKRN